MTTTVTITKRGAERARARHCWIYRSDVSNAKGARPGDVVRVVDHAGRALGRALYSSRSQITLRFISFQDEEIERAFWRNRLLSAQQLRNEVVRDTSAYRLVFGESDLLPSLIIDRYNDCFEIQTLSQGMESLKQMWVDLLAELYHPRAIIERNEARVRDLEGLPRTRGIVHGSDPGELLIEESGVRLEVNLLEGQKTGAFLDQRENRIAAASYARGRVLDCFTFQGGFALHLARGCESVIGVDVSAAALAGATRNAQLNELSNITFLEGNVFDLLREMEERGERFDVINLDPPAFAKNRGSLDAAMRGYKEINLRALKLLNKRGALITSTCSYHLSEIEFLNVLADAAADAGRWARIIERRTQARDHPVLISMPETYYL
ncbi:MAG TPA: class I SAM-dependent rRNA methyltransferase, partial [Blastocatellia bacterium]|nr:class I SAM-dependent rRNA methyltransferase [Blastocatellia bacterium]